MSRQIGNVLARWPLRVALVVGLLAAVCLLQSPTSEAGNSTTTLALSDFLSAQGTHSWETLDPDDPEGEPGMFAWTGRPPEYPRAGYMDYAGANDRWLKAHGHPGLGTKVNGKFTRQSLGNDLYEFDVNVEVKNTMAWCKTTEDWTTMLLGCHVNDILAGTATPALGNCTFRCTWQQKGTSVPDLSFAANYGAPYRPEGFTILNVDLEGTATGPLHEAADLGPDGTPGMMHITQTCSNSHAFGNGKGNADGCPSEITDLKAVGK